MCNSGICALKSWLISDPLLLCMLPWDAWLKSHSEDIVHCTELNLCLNPIITFHTFCWSLMQKYSVLHKRFWFSYSNNYINNIVSVDPMDIFVLLEMRDFNRVAKSTVFTLLPHVSFKPLCCFKVCLFVFPAHRFITMQKSDLNEKVSATKPWEEQPNIDKSQPKYGHFLLQLKKICTLLLFLLLHRSLVN